MMAHFSSLELPKTWPEGVPSGVGKVLKTALTKKPADRYATAGEMAQTLEALTPERFAEPDRVSTKARKNADQVSLEPAPGIDYQGRSTWAEPMEKLPEGEHPDSLDSMDLASPESGLIPSTSAKKWRGFLAHLGPYIIVIGMLGLINLLTDSGGYPWFLWPAMGWGVGLAFHFFGIMLSEITDLSGKWRGFVGHFGSYAIIMALLIGIYLMTDPGGYPWFLWPALGWGAAVALHLWGVMLSRGGHREEKASRRAERRAARERRKAQKPSEKVSATGEALASPMLQAHLEKARTYQEQIDALLKSTSDRNVHVRLKDLANQMAEWTRAVEALAKRVDSFQQNAVIKQDLETVPQAIAKLKNQLATEADAATRAELEQTLSNRQNQLATLEHLRGTMKRAEIKIESTLSSLGTIYSQMLISQSTDHVADYGHLSAEMDEEVRTLQDHLEALEEVKFGLR
jgi:hypothetical protein